MSGNDKSDEVKHALNVAAQESTIMTRALITHLLQQVLTLTNLNDAEKAHVAGTQMLCILSVLNDHISRIGEQNFMVLSQQVQALIEKERTAESRIAGLSKLAALLLPLGQLTGKVQN